VGSGLTGVVALPTQAFARSHQAESLVAVKHVMAITRGGSRMRVLAQVGLKPPPREPSSR
jgi:hypothetical protein